MTAFLNTYVQKLDAKRRVSIPAPFRAALGRLGTEDIVVRPSHRAPCLDAMPLPDFERMAAARLAGLDPLGEEYEDVAATLQADAHPMRHDAEGRVQLPEFFVAHAGLSNEVAFRGLGFTFQLWEPAAARAANEAARARTAARGAGGATAAGAATVGGRGSA